MLEERKIKYTMKNLIIKNFGPIKDLDITLKRVNIIIGPQSSGKSTVLKVACFCDWIERQVAISQEPDKYLNAGFFVKNLVTFHKLEGFMHKDTYIKYNNDAISFDYNASNNKCTYKWSNAKRWNYKRSKIAYIPSERNLVAAIPNWFQVSMYNNNILDFMKEWEFARKKFTKKEQILGLPFSYRYNPNDYNDHIVDDNGIDVKLTNASSGLQSLTPLYIMIRYLTKEFFKDTQTKVEDSMLRDKLKMIVSNECINKTHSQQNEIVENILVPYRSDLFIEEPEAHIFPSTQKDFIYNLINQLNGQRKHSCFIATHSPYIMTALNNLIIAGELIATNKEFVPTIKTKFPKRQTLRCNDVAAFFMKDGIIESILDEELHLISADALDSASQEISEDFNFLLSYEK